MNRTWTSCLAASLMMAAGALPFAAADEPCQGTTAASPQCTLSPGETADILLEIRQHLGPGVLEGTLFQNGNVCAHAVWIDPGHACSQCERTAFIEGIQSLATEEVKACSATEAACSQVCAANGCAVNCQAGACVDCPNCATQTAQSAPDVPMSIAATVGSLRGAARQLEVAAGDIEDHISGPSIEAAKLAWKQSDELREVARTLRAKADSVVLPEAVTAVAQISLKKNSACTCCSAQSTVAQASTRTAGGCAEGCQCEHSSAKVASTGAACEEMPILTKLPYLTRLFKNMSSASCEDLTPNEFGIPSPTNDRMFVAVRVAPTANAAEATPSIEELETSIDHLTEELNKLRSQLRAQTSRRVVSDHTQN